MARPDTARIDKLAVFTFDKLKKWKWCCFGTDVSFCYCILACIVVDAKTCRQQYDFAWG
jgi:hypothetical protein